MRTFCLILGMIFINGCTGSNNIKLTSNLKLTSQSIHIDAPPSSFGIAWEAWYLTSTKNNIQLFRHLPNMMSENVNITVRIPPENQNINYLLDKKKSNDLERTTALPPSERNQKNMEERGVVYNKNYVDYIDGLKCVTDAESSSPALGVGFKKYFTVCGYYDTSGNKKRIDIMYHYISSFNGTKFQSDTTSTIASGKDIDTLFKQDMKAIFDSLVIHDMDRERMSKEGLLHERKYDVESEFRSR